LTPPQEQIFTEHTNITVVSQSHIKSGITKFKTQQPITIPEAIFLNISSSAVVAWVVGAAGRRNEAA
jgi:hypothetical protein